MRLEGTSDVSELQVLGDWGIARTYLRVTMTPPTGVPVRRHCYAMTIFRKGADGLWRLARYANLLTAVN